MESTPPTDADETLVEAAAATAERALDDSFFDGAHIVASAVRAADGSVHEGVSLPASVGRASMCAEPVAVGSAVADGHAHDDVDTCVAVSSPMPSHDAEEARVVPPCGACRELLADHDERMRVLVPLDDELRVVRAADLLPSRPW